MLKHIYFNNICPINSNEFWIFNWSYRISCVKWVWLRNHIKTQWVFEYSQKTQIWSFIQDVRKSADSFNHFYACSSDFYWIKRWTFSNLEYPGIFLTRLNLFFSCVVSCYNSDSYLENKLLMRGSVHHIDCYVWIEKKSACYLLKQNLMTLLPN